MGVGGGHWGVSVLSKHLSLENSGRISGAERKRRYTSAEWH